MKQIDINCDLGEGFGLYTIGQDEELLSYISSANIACGFHAGDPHIMNKTVAFAKQKGVSVGAHPGFYDLHGFGRRPFHLSADEIIDIMLYQLGALKAFCTKHEVPLVHVKPHGALYNIAAKEPYVAKAIVSAVKQFDPTLIVYGLANSELIQACVEENIPYAIEAFIDRTYQDDGSLTPRQLEGSTLHSIDECIQQALSIVLKQKVTTITGNSIPLEVDTLCIHGDHQGSVDLARALREELATHNVIVRSLEVSI
ncbi:5-oxoprolinase subunit PxpA [Bacillus pinisoli]|uniref:5-oxoprolinase subunit PxpA n=1 Tax=Bacillus pinisoli TaxID=2901866 RepID=UPI001FF224AE|nr:5-oxoprolinase subunit PxpA [Bacillus pinisoli]